MSQVLMCAISIFLVNGVFRLSSLAHELFKSGLFGLGLVSLACTETRDGLCDCRVATWSWSLPASLDEARPPQSGSCGVQALSAQGQGKGLAGAKSWSSGYITGANQLCLCLSGDPERVPTSPSGEDDLGRVPSFS